MASNPPPDLMLTPLAGTGRALGEWLTNFHLVFVAIDPYTRAGAWLVPVLGKILLNFREADCRVSWLATAEPDKCRSFLGHWADDILTFTDPERVAVTGFGLTRLPSLVHVGLDGSILGAAEGWDPAAWRDVTTRLARMMAWLPPTIPLG